MSALTTADVPAVEEFLNHGLIRGILGALKSGKEATTYLCRGGRDVGGSRYVVAKVYHDLQKRNFANDAAYQDGRLILNGQVNRAVAKKTEFGKNANLAMWVDHEFETLSTLHYAGVDVPEPFVCNEQAILMEFIGEGGEAAPQLVHAELNAKQAHAVFDRLLWDIETMLGQNQVHGDLSAYNVLWDEGRQRPVIIDFPQSADPRFSGH